MTSDNNHSPDKVLKGEETGFLVQQVDLSDPLSSANQTEPEMMMPHERDQNSGPTGTTGTTDTDTDSVGDKHSREVIKQGYEDTKNGLKDTDLIGVPSNIAESDFRGTEKVPNNPGFNSKDRSS